MSVSSIEWTEHTWNPIVGCSIISPGCTNCYAMHMAGRIEAMNASARDGHGNAPHYKGVTRKVNGRTVWTGRLALASEETLLAPLRRKKPTTYFVNSMGDLFHEDCPDEWIDRVFAVMALAPQHTFQVLTKRAKRMHDYCLGRKIVGAMATGHAKFWRAFQTLGGNWENLPMFPLKNVWLGVSTERQQEADERIPLLLQTPAAIRFISAEPLLGPIDLQGPGYTGFADDGGPHGNPYLDWVIVGGESGRGARPMHPDWVRSIRDQCLAANVPLFFKQWGNWHPEIDRDKDDPDWRQPYGDYSEPNFQMLNLAGGRGFHGERVHVMRLCSKKSAGRMLDGAEYSAMPERCQRERLAL